MDLTFIYFLLEGSHGSKAILAMDSCGCESLHDDFRMILKEESHSNDIIRLNRKCLFPFYMTALILRCSGFETIEPKLRAFPPCDACKGEKR